MKSETKISERRACILVGIDRLTFRYQPQIRDDASLRERMRELAKRWKRFGYRRLFVLLRCAGESAGKNRNLSALERRRGSWTPR